MSHWRTLISTLLAILFAAHLAFAAPSTVDTSSSASATANSSQRKTFFDTENEVHWAFYYNGTAIEYSYSADGVAWTSAGTLAYNTASFAVSFKVIAATPYVFLASEANSYDIVLRRGALTATSVTFAAEQTVYNGTAVADHYRNPTIALNGSDNIWVSAIHATIGYQAVVRRSTNSATGDLSLWEAVNSIDDSVNKINQAIVVSRSGATMFLFVSTENGQLNGYLYDGASWTVANTGGDYSWFNLTSSSGIEGSVSEIVLDGTDIYIAGDFTSVAGNSDAKFIARFDGNSWHELGSGLNDVVYSLHKDGNDIYVGGRFTNGGTTGSDRIARWNTVDQQWYPLGVGLAFSDVYAIGKLGDYLYIGGAFTNAGGTGSDRAVRWKLSNEQWEALGSGLNNAVQAIAVVGTEVYFGGQFTNGGGTGSDRIVRWDSVSQQWEAIGAGINNNTVLALAPSGTDLYVAGTFTNVGNANGDGVVRLNTTNNTWSSLGTGIAVSAFGARVYALTISGTDIYAIGSFVNAGGNAAADYIARWSGASWNAFAGGSIQNAVTMTISGTDFYLGGSLANAGGVTSADGLAKWNGTAWSGLAQRSEPIFNGFVASIAMIGDDLFVGGAFTDAAGIAAADYIVRYDGANWSAVGSGLNGGVNFLEAIGTDLYIGGVFTNGGATGSDGIVRWDSVAQQWHPLGTGIAGGTIKGIAAMGTDIYIAGYIGDFAATGSNDIIRWDSVNEQWEGLGVGVDAGGIEGIEVLGTNVYIGGNFTQAGGVAADHIARWDTMTNQWYPIGAGLNSTVYYLFSSDTDIYVTGHFTDAGGVVGASGIARFDGSNWHALGSGINTAFVVIPVTSAVFYNSQLYITGGFESADGDTNIAGGARWDGSNWHYVPEIPGYASLAASDKVLYHGQYYLFEPVSVYKETIVNDLEQDSELTALSDAAGNIYLSYTNDSELVRFRRFDEGDGSWGDAVTLSNVAATSPALARNEARNLVTAAWAQANAVTYSAGLSPFEADDWSAPLAIYNTGSNAAVTLDASQGTDDLMIHWTNGAANPYSIFSDFLLMTVVPTVAISSSEVTPTKNSPIPLTIEFSANVTGFAVGDVAVTNGAKSNFVAVDANTYTLDVTPAGDGVVTVDIAAAVAEDVFGNDNTAATEFEISFDATEPTVSISSTAVTPTRTSPIPITFEFSEVVTGFAAGDVVVANGALSNFVAVDGDTYTAELVPTTDGNVTVDVAAAVAQDAASNTNLAATQFSIAYDSTDPTVAITSSAANPTSTAPIPLAFEFSESVTGFAVGDVVVTNGVIGNFVAVDGNSYTAQVSPNADGMVSIAVASAVAQDAAGNLSVAASTLTRLYQSLDSDGDGVSDATEGNDGTNAADSGSFLSVLPTSWCSEWNGYFGMYNVNEYSNLSGGSRSIVATLFDSSGEAQSSSGFNIAAAQQNDFLVHAMPGWSEDSYGKVCSEVNSGQAGDVDGRMVYYMPSASGFDFAFSLAYSGGLPGSQFVTFNTMQPSLNPDDAQNEIANWIQLTNLESTEQRGSLIFYAENGEVLASEAVTLGGEMRRDFAAHALGSGLVGLVEWRPQSGSAEFVLRNTRYYYDNSEMLDSFAAAAPLEGVKGNGEVISALLDTRGQLAVLEVANATASELGVVVQFYKHDGILGETQQLTLAPYGSQHLVANSVLQNEVGHATINGAAIGSVIAMAMHYGQSADYSLTHAYNVVAKQPLGTTLHSSYNTYLGQDCELQLVNTSSETRTSTLTMTRLDATPVLTEREIEIAPKHAAIVALCSEEEANQYGTVSVETEKNTTQALLLRSANNGDFRFVVPVR